MDGVLEDKGFSWLPPRLLDGEVVLAAGLVRAAAILAGLALPLSGVVVLHPFRFARIMGAREFFEEDQGLFVLKSSGECGKDNRAGEILQRASVG